MFIHCGTKWLNLIIEIRSVGDSIWQRRGGGSALPLGPGAFKFPRVPSDGSTTAMCLPAATATTHH